MRRILLYLSSTEEDMKLAPREGDVKEVFSWKS